MAEQNYVGRVQMHAGGPEFSSVVWGSMRAEEQFATSAELADHLRWLLDQGVTTIDAAAIYGIPHPYSLEEFLGKAIADVGRDNFEIVTKCGIQRISPLREVNRVRHFDFSAKEIFRSVDNSLQKLGIDVIDVLLLHRPDYLMDADETAGALEKLVADGKVKHLGVSNFSASRMDMLAARLKKPIITNQIEFSPLHLDPVHDGSFDRAQRLAYRPMIWSPVGGGRLLTSDEPEIVKLRNVLTRISKDYGLEGPADAAIAFVTRHPAGCVPVVGSGKRERVASALKAAAIELDRQEWYEIMEQTHESLFFGG